MLGKILIVDPIATNRIVMRVKLAAAHYEVMQAESVGDAVELAGTQSPDLILTAADLPDGDAAKLARRLWKVGLRGKVPVMALMANPNPERRLALLAAGVDEVAFKPLDDGLLFARLRSLIRAYSSSSEWELRDDTSRALGFAERPANFGPMPKVAIVSTNEITGQLWAEATGALMDATVSLTDPAHAWRDRDEEGAPDAFVLVTGVKDRCRMRDLLATIRSQSVTRHAAILMLQLDSDPVYGAQALDMGANDLMSVGFHGPELALRLSALLQRKRMNDDLRATVRNGLEAAVSDPLTGLYNRRYAMPHLARVSERAFQTNKPFAVMIADLDHFKRINDLYGHAAGDAVLIEAAERLRENLRGIDTVARIGGEEFLIILPGANLINAQKAALRLCDVIGGPTFKLPDITDEISVTVSIGMTVCDPNKLPENADIPTAQALIDRADKALYAAKSEGRNRVTMGRPAA